MEIRSGVELRNWYNSNNGLLSWNIEITLEIDAKRHASIKHAVKKEIYHAD